MNAVFPKGWDGGIDEDVFAVCVEDDRRRSLHVGNSVLRFMGRQSA